MAANTWLPLSIHSWLLAGPCAVVIVGDGWDLQFLYQVMSPVVKQCDRKSVQLWWLSSVLCPSTFSSRSLSKAHLKCTVCSLWMTHPQENELYGAGSLANKHFTICSVYWSTLLTYSLNPQTTNTNPDKPILFCSASKAHSVRSSRVNVSPVCYTCNDYITNTHNNETSVNAPEFLVILFIETANLSSLHQLPWRPG